jgi:hypothetical protein
VGMYEYCTEIRSVFDKNEFCNIRLKNVDVNSWVVYISYGFFCNFSLCFCILQLSCMLFPIQCKIVYSLC